MTQESFWMMRTFNPLFFATFAAFILLLVIASLLLRKRSERAKKIVLITACVLTFIGFFVYKYFLSIDTEYDKLVIETRGGFSWWAELPLQLCNINMIIIPIAVATKFRPLMSFSFFLAPLGALMALMFPAVGFTDCSIWLPRMIGFYGTHFMIIIEAIALVTFGFYRPRFQDLPKTVLTLVILMLVITGINLLLIKTGLYNRANYFFTMEHEGISILKLFWSWIPVPVLYLLPGAVILGVYMLLVTTPFAIADRLKKKKA
ncbi:MAG: YwaF family protein [Clostridia bacterium]|nr:YwaF family protein [Clostridia bacterium]